MSLRDSDIVFLSSARTPIGRYMGSLAAHTPTQLGVAAAKAAIERAGVSPEAIDAVFVGNVIQSSADAVYVARHIGLRAGVPHRAPALTLNRLCGSGLEALLCAARSLRAGEIEELAIAGGTENMSMVPHVLRGGRGGLKLGQTTQLEDMLWTALYDPEAGGVIGESLEDLAGRHGITREAADEAAVWSQQAAAAAQARGRFDREIVAVDGFERDEHLHPDTTLEKLSGLRPAYKNEGVITVGNASGLNDASSMLVMSRGAYARAHGLKVMGRLVSSAVVGVPPIDLGLGPIPAIRLALERAGLKLCDMDLIEINDAFAVQYIVVERALGFSRERVNLNGGCLALGHPMGATGARLVQTALIELEERDVQHALVTMAIGGGQGIAAILERVPSCSVL